MKEFEPDKSTLKIWTHNSKKQKSCSILKKKTFFHEKKFFCTAGMNLTFKTYREGKAKRYQSFGTLSPSSEVRWCSPSDMFWARGPEWWDLKCFQKCHFFSPKSDISEIFTPHQTATYLVSGISNEGLTVGTWGPVRFITARQEVGSNAHPARAEACLWKERESAYFWNKTQLPSGQNQRSTSRTLFGDQA